MKKVGILQSNYIPWKGYFDLISKVDLFVFHDDLQYTKNDWRNRNKIKAKNGLIWLTIPCGSSEKRLICEVELKDVKWQKKHWSQIEQNYSKAPFFKMYKEVIKGIYFDKNWDNLSELNQYIIKFISKDILELKTQFIDSRSLNLSLSKNDRVIEILEKTDAEYYLSGPAAKDYLVIQDFVDRNIELEFMDYSKYKEYDQINGEFVHAVTILDVLFHVGPDIKKYVIS